MLFQLPSSKNFSLNRLVKLQRVGHHPNGASTGMQSPPPTALMRRLRHGAFATIGRWLGQPSPPFEESWETFRYQNGCSFQLPCRQPPSGASAGPSQRSAYSTQATVFSSFGEAPSVPNCLSELIAANAEWGRAPPCSVPTGKRHIEAICKSPASNRAVQCQNAAQTWV